MALLAQMGFADTVAYVLVSLVAINWGTTTFLGFDWVGWASKQLKWTGLGKVVYGVAALSGVYALFLLFVG
jgi:uncharacterized membrane protein YuzA (DUF378 family)